MKEATVQYKPVPVQESEFLSKIGGGQATVEYSVSNYPPYKLTYRLMLPEGTTVDDLYFESGLIENNWLVVHVPISKELLEKQNKVRLVPIIPDE